MAVVKCKPTSPGRRHVVKVVNPELHKGKPFAPLLEKNSKSGGRNNNGRITTRHIGGGHKQAYRIVDFKRNKDGIPAVVERLEYDPNYGSQPYGVFDTEAIPDEWGQYKLPPAEAAAAASLQSEEG